MKTRKEEPKEHIPKVAALYCRVSTSNQAQGDYSSLDAQESKLRDYCKLHEIQVYKVYRDTRTGSTLEREELTRLLEEAASGKFNQILVTKLDRLSRSIRDFQNLHGQLQEYGIDVVAVTQHLDMSTFSGRFMRDILIAFAEFERNMIAERTVEKMLAQAEQGKHGGGITILGYDLVDKKLIVNEEEAKLVRYIYKKYLELPSCAKLAKLLNREGYRTKKRTSKSGRESGGGLFNEDTVRRTLTSRRYIGKVTFKDEDFEGIHEAIIEDELFAKVQARLAESQKSTTETYVSETPLTLLGVMRCGFCGHQLTSTSTRNEKGQKYYYYKCTTATKTGKESCPAKDVKASDIEGFVQRLITHMGKDEDLLESAYARMLYNGSEGLQSAKHKLARLGGIRSGIIRDLNAYVESLRDPKLINSPTIAQKIADLEEEKKAVEKEIEDVKLAIELEESKTITKDDLRRALQQRAALYDRMSLENKRLYNKGVFLEIRSYLKRREKTGEVEFKFRADGSLRLDWEKIKNPELPRGLVNFRQPESSSPSGGWLREQDSNLQPCG